MTAQQLWIWSVWMSPMSMWMEVDAWDALSSIHHTANIESPLPTPIADSFNAREGNRDFLKTPAGGPIKEKRRVKETGLHTAGTSYVKVTRSRLQFSLYPVSSIFYPLSSVHFRAITIGKIDRTSLAFGPAPCCRRKRPLVAIPGPYHGGSFLFHFSRIIYGSFYWDRELVVRF